MCGIGKQWWKGGWWDWDGAHECAARRWCTHFEHPEKQRWEPWQGVVSPISYPSLQPTWDTQPTSPKATHVPPKACVTRAFLLHEDKEDVVLLAFSFWCKWHSALIYLSVSTMFPLLLPSPKWCRGDMLEPGCGNDLLSTIACRGLSLPCRPPSSVAWAAKQLLGSRNPILRSASRIWKIKKLLFKELCLRQGIGAWPRDVFLVHK